MIKFYNDFIEALLTAGFTLAGDADGIYSVSPWGFETNGEESDFLSGDPETDRWEWCSRILNTRPDILYGKLFFGKSGYITKEWFPYFLAARQGGVTLEEAYADGTVSHYAKRIYDVLAESGMQQPPDIKQKCGFTKEDKAGFERAMAELQAKMYIATCGRQQKVSQQGEPYGWPTAVFCTMEQFMGDEVFSDAAEIGRDEAAASIRKQVLKLNPNANEKKITKFIYG